MIFSRLYSNRPNIFPAITFRAGINVVLARVLERKDPTKDSHCLGKTLLIDVLDFCMLKKCQPDFFLKRHRDRFDGFEFYLEIITNSTCITIRRTVEEMSKASVRRHPSPGADFANSAEEEWDHWLLPFERAVQWLDGALALTSLQPFPYRTGLGYFLRRQSDFTDVFRLGGVGRGKDRKWKPYVAHVLGLNADILIAKYDADQAIEDEEKLHSRVRASASFDEDDFDRLRGQIEIKQDELASEQGKIDEFDFHDAELGIASELVEDVERETSELNTRIYNLRYDIEQARAGLATDVPFDVTAVDRVFREASIYFPDQLKNGYEALVTFNRRILEERRSHLTERLGELTAELEEAERNHASSAERRMRLLAVLKQQDVMKKFKQIQASHDRNRAQLALMQERFSQMSELIALRKRINAMKLERQQIVTQIDEITRENSARYRSIRLGFAKLVRDVLDRNAEMFVKVNSDGNLDFHAEFQGEDDDGSFTSEGRGTTYRKFLCMAFDLAVLQAYANSAFFRFVYHDGALETEDNRRKLRWIAAVREACAAYGLQYILTVIEDDLPRDSDDRLIAFPDDEIIRILHDRGDDGRLFRMPKF